jgi:hypothetical protein
VSYRVVFAPQANRDLVDLWLESSYQHEFTRAVDGLVRDLERDPTFVGESRQANRRVAFEWPVGIAFQIDESNRQVTIYQLWTFSKRKA